MQRNIQKLTQHEYDVLIIGGGVYGAACAWDAALRGLQVALLERADFGGATSANSAKIAHSGVRYLQHADFKRLRESARERSILMHNAPHLVRSLPYLFPLYGHGLKGREVMTLYLGLYDMLSWDQRRSRNPARCVPRSRFMSRREVLNLVPEVEPQSLTGGAVWYEGQIHNTERLLLSYLRSASERGAEVANYVEARKLLHAGNAVVGVEAADRLSGHTIAVRAHIIVNASGPWIAKTLNASRKHCQNYHLPASKALSLVTRPLTRDYALVFPIRAMYQDRQALVNKQSSLVFAVPWRGYSLVGSLHLPCADDPDRVSISEEEIHTYLDLINQGYPAAKLRRDDVRHVLWGIVPADHPDSAAPLKHYRLIDHAREEGMEGLISVVGVKFTTTREVAQKTINLVFHKLARVSPTPLTQQTPLWGGKIESLDGFLQQATERESERLSPEIVHHLVHTYGAAYPRVLAYLEENPAWKQLIPQSEIMQAEVIHAIREEMAQKLADVVLRRTDLGSAGYPGEAPLLCCAQLMADELGWDHTHLETELREVADSYLVRPALPAV